MPPVVSVVVPVWNIEGYVDQCVSSVLDQSFESFEVILVDDGSTDRSRDICDGWADKDARVRVIHRDNGGLSAARNSGLAAAAGELVCFLDGDDWAEPGWLAHLVRAQRESGAEVVVTGVKVEHRDDSGEVVRCDELIPSARTIGPGSPPPEIDLQLINFLGYAWNKIYLRLFLDEHALRFEEGTSLVEDILFNAAALRTAEVVAVEPAAFVHYVQRPRVTLGSAYYPDLLALKARAIDQTRDLLVHWRVAPERVEGIVATMTARAVAMAARSVVAQPGGRRAQRSLLRAMLADADVAELVAGCTSTSALRRQDRWVLAQARRRRTRGLLLLGAVSARRPRRRGR
ncbi:MAG: glycosyltransferase [Propionibacteriales bacterium]|nr:glycosyltransferase [Propionibacteriales bacterium]